MARDYGKGAGRRIEFSPGADFSQRDHADRSPIRPGRWTPERPGVASAAFMTSLRVNRAAAGGPLSWRDVCSMTTIYQEYVRHYSDGSRPGEHVFATLTSEIREMALEQVQFRELLLQITLRDLRVRYKQTIMGFGWAMFVPLVNTAVTE